MIESSSLGNQWEWVRSYPVGGLIQVGFGRNRDLLLVHSPNGLGLFDTLSGEKIGRDFSADTPYDLCIGLELAGFGLLSGEMVRMAGFWGGGLRQNTSDFCRLDRDGSNWPNEEVILRLADKRTFNLEVAGEAELRAYGFSDSGHSFVVATGASLHIYRRIVNNHSGNLSLR